MLKLICYVSEVITEAVVHHELMQYDSGTQKKTYSVSWNMRAFMAWVWTDH